MYDAARTHDPDRIHEELVTLARDQNRLLVRQATLLARAEELELWRRFNTAHIYEYLEQYCDLKPRTAREYVRVSRALVALPVMRAELAAERLRYSVARELTRIATPDNEVEWIEHVRGMTAREVEDEIAGRDRGDRPHDPRDPDRLVPLTLEIRESTYSIFVDARLRYADVAGEHLSDDDFVLALCRESAPGDEPDADDAVDADDANADVDTTDGLAHDEAVRPAAPAKPTRSRPAYQLAIATCRTCTKSFQITAGRELEVSPAMLAVAHCDARYLGDLESDAFHRTTWTVTARIRNQVLLRDRKTCVVPGCRAHRFLDVHHIHPQSEGGDHKASNLIALCAAHHRQLHEGRLTIRGRAPHELTFQWPTEPARTSTRDR